MKRDNSCLFHSLYYYVKDQYEDHNELRDEICKFVLNSDEILKFCFVTNEKSSKENRKEHVKKMLKRGKYILLTLDEWGCNF